MRFAGWRCTIRSPTPRRSGFFASSWPGRRDWRLFARFDGCCGPSAGLTMGGQIIDATVIEARRPRLTRTDKQTIKGGSTPAGGSRRGAPRSTATGAGRSSVAAGAGAAGCVPPAPAGDRRAVFGYKNHVGIDRTHGLLRAMSSPTPRVITAGSSAPCSTAKYRQRCVGRHRLPFSRQSGLARPARSQVAIPAHKAARQEDAGPCRPRQRHPGSGALRVEHVFAAEKAGLGWWSAPSVWPGPAKIGLANLAYNLTRLAWIQGRPAPI